MPSKRFEQVNYHLSMLFLESVAISHLRRRMPINHRDYLVDHMRQFDSENYDGASYMMGSFATVSTEATFTTGLKLLLDAFESWLKTNNAVDTKR
jgi:hypothetical protein